MFLNYVLDLSFFKYLLSKSDHNLRKIVKKYIFPKTRYSRKELFLTYLSLAKNVHNCMKFLQMLLNSVWDLSFLKYKLSKLDQNPWKNVENISFFKKLITPGKSGS